MTRTPLPQGYRQGIVAAITVLLGFSLLFLRFWSFEAPGDWTPASAVAAGLLFLAVDMQIFALWRSLRVEDDDVAAYRVTLRWFVSSAAVLLLSLMVAQLAYSGLFGDAATSSG